MLTEINKTNRQEFITICGSIIACLGKMLKRPHIITEINQNNTHNLNIISNKDIVNNVFVILKDRKFLEFMAQYSNSFKHMVAPVAAFDAKMQRLTFAVINAVSRALADDDNNSLTLFYTVIIKLGEPSYKACDDFMMALCLMFGDFCNANDSNRLDDFVSVVNQAGNTYCDNNYVPEYCPQGSTYCDNGYGHEYCPQQPPYCDYGYGHEYCPQQPPYCENDYGHEYCPQQPPYCDHDYGHEYCPQQPPYCDHDYGHEYCPEQPPYCDHDYGHEYCPEQPPYCENDYGNQYCPEEPTYCAESPKPDDNNCAKDLCRWLLIHTACCNDTGETSTENDHDIKPKSYAARFTGAVSTLCWNFSTSVKSAARRASSCYAVDTVVNTQNNTNLGRQSQDRSLIMT